MGRRRWSSILWTLVTLEAREVASFRLSMRLCLHTLPSSMPSLVRQWTGTTGTIRKTSRSPTSNVQDRIRYFPYRLDWLMFSLPNNTITLHVTHDAANPP